ncbi:hypothetical protein LINGRAHAP2_LOCUS3597 [Linum grandiflorum]
MTGDDDQRTPPPHPPLRTEPPSGDRTSGSGFTFGTFNSNNQTGNTSEIAFGNPYYLNPNENLSQSIVSIVLNGSNYQVWSRSIRFALKTKHKLGFVDGTLLPPLTTSDRFPLWDACNTMVLCWIMNSLHSEIRRSVLSHENAHTLWMELKKRFGSANALKIANLQDEIHACKQDSMSVTQYYTIIKGLWEEYSQYSPIVACNCAPGNTVLCPAVAAFQEKQDTDYLIRFLRGLNVEFDVIKTQLLMMKPLPSVTVAYDDVLQHEEKLKGGNTIGKEQLQSQHAVFSVPTSDDPKTALAAFSPRPNLPGSASSSAKKFCRYCRKDNHVIEDCLKLKWKKKQELERGNTTASQSGSNRFANVVTHGRTEDPCGISESPTPNFTAAEFNQLRILLQQSQPQHSAHAVMQSSLIPPFAEYLSVAFSSGASVVFLVSFGAGERHFELLRQCISLWVGFCILLWLIVLCSAGKLICFTDFF